MDKCIRNRDEKQLWSKIQSACLKDGQTSFRIELYRFNRGFMGFPNEFSEPNVEPRKISSFLKNFCQKYKLEYELLDKESRADDYMLLAVANIRIPHTTVSLIQNAQIKRNAEHENTVRKKVLAYYNIMKDYSMAKKLQPLILQDMLDVIEIGRKSISIHNNTVRARFIITENFIQVDPDYKSSYYSMYRHIELGGQILSRPDTTALALVLLDYIFIRIAHNYPTQYVDKAIRVLNIGVEVTIQVHGFSS